MKLRVLTNSELRIGDRFGRWTVVSAPARGATRREAFVECRCDCGTERVIPAYRLRTGQTRSCRCLANELAAARKTRLKHGHASDRGKSSEYMIWDSMKARCVNPSHHAYDDYGGRGITVCERWILSFESFLRDMGYRPSARHSIDRIDNNGNYEPGNCRWATRIEQASNRRSNRFVTHDGITQTVTSWAHSAGVPPGVLSQRLKLGWPLQKALSAPVRRCRRTA